ncbi:copper chaperone for superoxide dismutase [Biomphalaria glabrata]|nr:copper chaperone for superoxide dismutase [Biomphalaria glabrata]
MGPDGNNNSTTDGNVATKMEFAVELRSPCCVSRVEKALQELKGVSHFNIDLSTQRLIVEGSVVADTVQNLIETKTGIAAVLLGQGTNSQKNLGAGVAAISIGNSGVQGMLRFIQTDSTSCIIEGTIDKLPTDDPVYLTVHQTGDVTSGCNSCGSLFTSSSFQGILSHLAPKEDQTAEFKLVRPDLKLSDIIGRCVVVHKGSQEEIEHNTSQRLACGIVARSSGLFENSKRFCACDGITIWQQRQKEKETKS